MKKNLNKIKLILFLFLFSHIFYSNNNNIINYNNIFTNKNEEFSFSITYKNPISPKILTSFIIMQY